MGVRVQKPRMNPGTQCMSVMMSGKGVSQTARIYLLSETDDSLADLRPMANKSTTALSKYVGTLSVNIGV